MDDEPGPNRLVTQYHRHIGDPNRTSDIYAGFGLFFFGLGLGVAGVVVFLYSASLPETVHTLREVAIVSGGVAGPAVLVGVVVLLPVDRRMLIVAGVGSALCGVGIARFVAVYPQNFNVPGPDATAQVVGIYSTGIAFVVAATAAALIAYRVEQAATTTETAPKGDTAETVRDAAAADVERELNETDLSWGGVEKRDTRRLNLDTSALDDVDRETLAGSGTETRRGDSDVDDAVAQLEGLQGGNTTTASGESTDDQAAALSELREKQGAESEQTAWERLRALLFSK